MNSNDFVSHNAVLAEIANKSGDKGFKFASKGEVNISIQEALSELAMDSLYFKEDKVYTLERGCLTLELPRGAFNVRDIFGYYGDDCNPRGKKNIWWKENYKKGLSRNDWDNSNDPFFNNQGFDKSGVPSTFMKNRNNGGFTNPPSNLYYAGVSNGFIYLSPNCSRFQKVSVRFNSLGTSIGDAPIIPIFFKLAIVEYSVVQVLTNRIANNAVHPSKQDWYNLRAIYESKLYKPYDGSWDKALFRSKNMDKKQRQDLNEYLAKIND